MMIYNIFNIGLIYSKFFIINLMDITKREFVILTLLIFFTIILGIYPAPITDVLNYYVTTLIYTNV